MKNIKKYLVLLILTVLGIKLALMIPDFIESMTEKVDVILVAAEDVKVKVVCNGRIESTEEYEVKPKTSLYIDEVKVQVGSVVKAGDTLFTVDTASTAKLALAALEGSSAAGAISESTILSQIPEAIYAPADGVVNSIDVKNGSLCSETKVMLVLLGGEGMQMRATLSENIISKVKVGQTVSITGNGFKGKTYTGTVTYLSPQASSVMTTTGSETMVEGIINILDADENLRPGYTAKASILTEKKDNIVIIPYESLGQDKDNNQYVYSIKEGWAYKKNIIIGSETIEGVEVISGLAVGDRVALNPSDLEGNYVRVIDNNVSGVTVKD